MSDTPPPAPAQPGTCGNCHRPSRIRIVMEPGKDGLPWWLCTRCHGGFAPARPLPARPKK